MRARGGTAALIVVVAVGASCGGRSTSQSIDGSGGSSAGGSNATGGTGTAAAGGNGNVDCSKPPMWADCVFETPRFYYEAQTGICERFTHGVCPDRRNYFESEVDCLVACQGEARMDFTRCSSSSECVLVKRDCCVCETTTRESLVAVGSPLGLDRCGGLVDCFERCPPLEDPERAWFGASCAEGHCRVVDARHEPITECETDADCTLRRGMACCEDCDPAPANVISVNLAKHFSELVCGGPTVCDDCAVPEFPSSTVPVCTNGRCAVRRTR